jgi:hypothetical protein
MTNTHILDSLRGAHGVFTPVPDLEVAAVSPAEQNRYAVQSAYYAQRWQQLDPLLIAIKRYAISEAGRERITIDAIISPLNDTKYGWYLSLLGEPAKYQLAPPSDAIVSAEAALRGGLVFPNVPPHTLFVGIQDQAPLQNIPLRDAPRLLETVRTLPGYLGAWPKPGFLDLLPLNLAGTPSSDGLTQLLLGIWRWQGRGFSVLSMDPTILQNVDRQIGFVTADDAAQVRIRIGDLAQTQIRPWLDSWGYNRGRNVSAGNAQFLATLTQQLGVPQAEALQVAQELLDAELTCPLGGEYQLVDDGRGVTWKSTAAADFSPTSRVPDGYIAPALEWFRGLDADLLRYPARVVLRAHLDMQRKEREAALNLPIFDVLGKRKSADSSADTNKNLK